MSLEVFLLGLMIVSTLTSLATEAAKKILDEMNMKYHSNMLACVMSIVLSAGVGISYTVLTETAWNDKMAVILIALMLLSWMTAMVGYDKVVQAVSQFKSYSSGK